MLQSGVANKLIMLIIILFLSGITLVQADTLEQADDLNALAKTIRAQNKPLMLMFSAKHCEYCQRLREEQLLPILKDRAYDDLVIVREFKMDEAGYVQNFDGKQISYEDFAELYAIDVTPTVIFLDDKGRLLARNIVGYSNPYFYSAYMDNLIQTANRKLRRYEH